MNPNTVLITGATGFLGGTLARKLHTQGWKVVATGRNPVAGARLQAAGIEFQACHLQEELGLLDSLVRSVNHVVHCAALSSPWGRKQAFVASNVIATNNLLKSIQANGGQRLIAISTPSVSFAYEAQRNLSEDAPWPVPPANHYIATKRIVEQTVLASGLPCIVLRPKALFGPGDTTLLPRVRKVAARGVFPLFGNDCQLDLTWIEDAVEAVRLALVAPEHCCGKVYHITSDQPVSRQAALEALFQASGMNVAFKRLSLTTALRLGSTLEWISKLATFGKWEPPLTRYSVGALGYGQTLDISAAKCDLHYHPQTDILSRLRECGRTWSSSTN